MHLSLSHSSFVSGLIPFPHRIVRSKKEEEEREREKERDKKKLVNGVSR